MPPAVLLQPGARVRSCLPSVLTVAASLFKNFLPPDHALPRPERRPQPACVAAQATHAVHVEYLAPSWAKSPRPSISRQTKHRSFRWKRTLLSVPRRAST